MIWNVENKSLFSQRLLWLKLWAAGRFTVAFWWAFEIHPFHFCRLVGASAVCGSFWELLENCRSFEKACRTLTLVLWLSAVISRGSFSDLQSFRSSRVGVSIHRCSFFIESWLDCSFSVLSFLIPSYSFLLYIVFIRLLRNRWGRQSENLYLLISGT